MKRELTCIGCPMGCQITAEVENGKVLSLEGYTCNVGKKYAEEELTLPKRMVTALMPVYGGGEPLSVKTASPIEKSRIFDCLQEIAAAKALLPVHIGDVVLRGVCGTDIVSTRELW